MHPLLSAPINTLPFSFFVALTFQAALQLFHSMPVSCQQKALLRQTNSVSYTLRSNLENMLIILHVVVHSQATLDFKLCKLNVKCLNL